MAEKIDPERFQNQSRTFLKTFEVDFLSDIQFVVCDRVTVLIRKSNKSEFNQKRTCKVQRRVKASFDGRDVSLFS